MSVCDTSTSGRNLNDQEKYIYDLIIKGHTYYNNHDKKYKIIVFILKMLVLLSSLASTIVLGLYGVLALELQVNIGLVLSAFISFLTGVSAYFNFEKYWMRNIKAHIKFNILRDGFIYDIKSTDKLSDEKMGYYIRELQKIQEDNISYWKEAINKSR